MCTQIETHGNFSSRRHISHLSRSVSTVNYPRLAPRDGKKTVQLHKTIQCSGQSKKENREFLLAQEGLRSEFEQDRRCLTQNKNGTLVTVRRIINLNDLKLSRRFQHTIKLTY